MNQDNNLNNQEQITENQIVENNVSEQTNVKKKTPVIKIVIVLIMVVSVISILSGVLLSVFSNDNKSSNDTNKQQETSKVEEQEDENKLLTKAKLDLYNDIKNSKYMSVVLYDPLKERQPSGDKKIFDKPIIVTYELEDNVQNAYTKNKFVITAEKKEKASFKYFYSLMGNQHIAYCYVGTNVLEDGSIDLAVKAEEINGIMFYTNTFGSSIITYDKDYVSSDDIYGSNFYALNLAKFDNTVTSTNRVGLKIPEIEEKNVYVYITLNDQISYGNSFVPTVESYINENKFKETISIIDNIDDLSSTFKVYGNKVDLNKTTFYQDIVAKNISEQYGLNLRNKDFFIHLDTTYMKFRAYGQDDYLTIVNFTPLLKPVDYNTISTTMPENKFSYKDKDGNQYEYFLEADKGTLYVFKNQECSGKIEVAHRGNTSKNVYEDLNYLFGTK